MLLLHNTFSGEAVADFKLCSAFRKSLNSKIIPNLSRSNGFKYPSKPSGLPPLDPISARLIPPRLSFMQIRRLRYEGNYAIMGKIINVPVDVNTMVQAFGRRSRFQREHKEEIDTQIYIFERFMKKFVVKAWLRYLKNQPLHKH
jgi:hypothetical protein